MLLAWGAISVPAVVNAPPCTNHDSTRSFGWFVLNSGSHTSRILHAQQQQQQKQYRIDSQTLAAGTRAYATIVSVYTCGTAGARSPSNERRSRHRNESEESVPPSPKQRHSLVRPHDVREEPSQVEAADVAWQSDAVRAHPVDGAVEVVVLRLHGGRNDELTGAGSACE